jgi:hypothetical protein
VKPLLYLSILFVACGLCGCSDDSDNGSDPPQIEIADLEGNWNCTVFLVTNANDQTEQFELIAMGGSLFAAVAPDGSFVGEASFPGDGGVPVVVPIGGTFTLVSQTELSIQFAVEFPPFLENDTVEFTLSGNTLTLHDEVTTFDFDFDEVEEAAILDATLVR